MKYLSIIIVLLVIGCDDRPDAVIAETNYRNVSEACLNRVVYYTSRSAQGYRVYTVKLNIDSKVETCGDVHEYEMVE
tara:strand:- start:679 stop:909 length:231 start_codon:yes stop_codon:yes gene_type:complete